MVGNLVENLKDVPPPVIVLAVGLLACAETAAFIGLAVPGEVSVVFGGVLAFQGRVPLAAVMSAAIVGAILGDSLGFALGRHFRGRLADGRVARLMGRQRVERTMARIRAGGMKAIILGRFVGVLRAVMPFAAGASGLRYARFLVASVIGATSWAAGFTLLGYVAGNSWRRVETYAGRASTVLAVVLVTVFLLVMLARKLVEQQDKVRAAWSRWRARPRVAAFHGRYQRQIEFLVARFRPGPVAGLQLTLALAALALLGYAVAVVFSQVHDLAGLAGLDRDVRRALTNQPRSVLHAAELVHRVFSLTGAAVVAAVVGGVIWVKDRRPRALVLLGLTVAGSAALAEAVNSLVTRPNPLVDGARANTFPARATTVVAATAIALLVVLVPRLRHWRNVVEIAVVLLGIVIATAFAELMVVDAFLSDAVGGAALGALWGLAVATAVATIWPGARRTAIASDKCADSPDSVSSC